MQNKDSEQFMQSQASAEFMQKREFMLPAKTIYRAGRCRLPFAQTAVASHRGVL